MTTYTIPHGDPRITFRANFAEASAPITLRNNDTGEFEPTPYQVADARHSPNKAAALLLAWIYAEGANYLWDERLEDEPDSILAAATAVVARVGLEVWKTPWRGPHAPPYQLTET